MRKWIAALILLVVIAAGIYLILPKKINIHQQMMVPVNTKAFAREIINEQKWQHWWPGAKAGDKELPLKFEYNGNNYWIVEKRMTSLLIEIAGKKDSMLTELIFIPSGNDTVQLNWLAAQKTSLSPLKRVQASNWMKNVEADISSLLKKIQTFYSNEDNIYGLHIQKSLVADSNYMFTSTHSETYPSTETIYTLLDQLKFYIKNNNAQPTGLPMLNVYQDNDGTYLTKVALPVNKQLKNAGNIQYRWMLKGGNILVTEVKGGPGTIENAFEVMQQYMQDHQRIAPAIPFQSLITDRRQEADSSKWITKLYWPVM